MAFVARWGSFAVFAAALCACGGGGKTDDPIEEPPEETFALGRFDEEATTFAVPVSGNPSGFYSANSTVDDKRWALLDMNADGMADLVQTCEPGTINVFGLPGNPHWRVYLNDGTRFSPSPVEWSVPQDEAFTFAELEGDWKTFDLTGDGRPDLVHTHDTNGKVFGHGALPVWHVYVNSGTAFETSSTDWPLPVDPGGDGIFWVENADAQNGAWSLLDFDNDGKLDLIRTAAPSGGVVTVIGHGTSPRWEFYQNNGSGFAPAVSHSVPAQGLPTRGLYKTTNAASWLTADLDGDGALEIAVTSDGDDTVLYNDGFPVWKVYTQGETGFATVSTDWTVPNSGDANGYYSHTMSDVQYQWSTTDLDADGQMDLVSTSNYHGGSAAVWGNPESPQWKFYRGGDSGFDRDAHSWTVPESGGTSGFYALEMIDNEDSWIVVDLTGDGVAELVQTADPDVGGGQVFGFEAGTPHWRVYAAVPSGLELGE